MRILLAILTILSALAVMAAHANSESPSGSHLLSYRTSFASVNEAQMSYRRSLPADSGRVTAGAGARVAARAGLTLDEPKKPSRQELSSVEQREDLVPNTEPTAKVALTGNDEDEGEEEEGEEDEGEEEDEGQEEGPDRIWDSPLLG